MHLYFMASVNILIANQSIITFNKSLHRSVVVAHLAHGLYCGLQVREMYGGLLASPSLARLCRDTEPEQLVALCRAAAFVLFIDRPDGLKVSIVCWGSCIHVALFICRAFHVLTFVVGCMFRMYCISCVIVLCTHVNSTITKPQCMHLS